MKVSWDNPEKTRVRIDDGTTETVVPTTEDHPLWNKVARQIRRGKVTVADHVIVKNDPPPPSLSYQQARAVNYPSLAELADALYWKERGAPEKFDQWLAACDAVKKALPKTKEQA